MRYDYTNPLSAPLTPGKNVFILGQSIDGPVHSPVLVESVEQAVKIFGSGNLLSAYAQVAEIPDISVHLMRISGEHARLSLLGNLGEAQVPLIKFRSVNGGEVYNGIHIYIGSVKRDGEDEIALIIESPFESYGKSYVLSDYNTLQSLLQDINNDAKADGLVYGSTDYPMVNVTELRMLNEEPLAMQGGEDGEQLTRDEVFLALERCYELLEGREIDVICPFPARVDDAHPAYFYEEATYGKATYGSSDYLALLDTEGRLVTFHEQLIRFCERQEASGVMTHGVIGLQEVKGFERKSVFYLSRLLSETAFKNRYGFVDFENGSWVDGGYRISVFAQDYAFTTGQEVYEANGCAMYAGMIAATKPEEGTTNRPLPLNATPLFELSPMEMKDLAAIGAVTSRYSVKRGHVIANGITAALNDSPFYNVANIRSVQFVLYGLNLVLDDLVGEPFQSAMTLKTVSKRIEDTMRHFVTTAVVKEYDYEVSFDEASQSVQVNLRLKPRYFTEFVDAKASMKFSNNGGVQ